MVFRLKRIVLVNGSRLTRSNCMVRFGSGDLNLTLAPTPHKHLYLWSDHRAKGAQW